MESYLCLIRFVLLFWISTPEIVVWIVPQSKANVWVTLAKAINQDHVCLSMTGVEDSLSTCLVA